MPEEVQIPSLVTMYELRMRSEGRGEEFKELMDAERANPSDGKKFHWANTRIRVLKQMGMGTTAEEKELYLSRMQKPWIEENTEMEQAAKDRKEEKLVEGKIEKMRNMESLAQGSFERAVAGLSMDAPETEVLRWIAAHPAMSRQDRASDKTQPIKITPGDIKKSTAGKCPSMKAARDLQHWANNPGAFRKDHAEMLRKAVAIEKIGKDEETSDGEEKLPNEYKQDVSEIREMLSAKDEFTEP